MTTAFNLRKLLHRKSWEMCTIAPSVTTSGSFVVSDKYNIIPNSLAYMVTAAGNNYRYDGDEDAGLQFPASGIAGVFGPGSCGEIRDTGAMDGTFTQDGTDGTGGTTTTIITNKTKVRNLVNRRLRVIAGIGSGYDQFIPQTQSVQTLF